MSVMHRTTSAIAAMARRCLSKPVVGIPAVRKLLSGLLLLGVLFLPPLAATAHGGGSAEEAVERLNQAILTALHQPAATDFATRVGLLRPLMVEAFDYPVMARIAAGKYWEDFTEPQRDRYVGLFADLSVAAAASRFKAQPNARLTITGVRDGPRNTELIETTLTLPGKPSRRISYLMRQDEAGQWKAVDIYFESRVSELSTKRSEYSSLLGRQGIAVFLETLQKKLSEYQEEA